MRNKLTVGEELKLERARARMLLTLVQIGIALGGLSAVFGVLDWMLS